MDEDETMIMQLFGILDVISGFMIMSLIDIGLISSVLGLYLIAKGVMSCYG